MVEGNTCICFRATWKLAFHTMAPKVSQIASCSLPWTQHKRWMPIGSMGCVHTHRRMLAIEGWGSPSSIWNVVQKIEEGNWKARKSSQLWAKCLPLGQNMIKFRYNGLQMSRRIITLGINYLSKERKLVTPRILHFNMHKCGERSIHNLYTLLDCQVSDTLPHIPYPMIAY
jgi:hypothetical protein